MKIDLDRDVCERAGNAAAARFGPPELIAPQARRQVVYYTRRVAEVEQR